MKEYLEYSLDHWSEIPVVEEHYMNKLIKLPKTLKISSLRKQQVPLCLQVL